MSSANLEQILELARDLEPEEKLRLIDELVHQLMQPPASAEKRAFPSLWGALAHLGPAPSLEEFQEARREAWAGFPREEP